MTDAEDRYEKAKQERDAAVAKMKADLRKVIPDLVFTIIALWLVALTFALYERWWL